MAEEFKNDMQGAAQSSKETAQNTREIKDNLNDMSMSAKDLRISLTDSLQELTNQKQVLNDTRKGFRNIRDIAAKLTLNQEEVNKLSAKELRSLKEKANESTELLKSVTEITAQTAQESQFQQEAIGFLKDKNGLAKEFSDELDKQIAQQEKIEELTGTTGRLIKGISKIPVVGELIDAPKALKASEVAAGKTGTKLGAMKGGLKSIGKSIFKNVFDPLTLTVATVKVLAKAVGELDKSVSANARSFGVSAEQATTLNKQLRSVTKSSDDIFISTKSLNESFGELNKRYGTFRNFNSQTLKDFTELNKKAGISVEALGSLQDLTMLNNKGLKETTKEFKGQVALQNAKSGLALNEAQVLEEIQNTSAAIKVSLGGSASAIGDAIFKAKSLGLELKDLEGISSSLLSFQSSIEDELSAELLTGKQLNLEGARYAALMNDQATLAEELAKNIGSAADFQAMNNIEQQAYAKAVGMSREQLANTLIQREALNKLDAKGNTLQEKYNNLKKQGLTDDQIASQLGDKSLADQLKSVSNAEKMDAIMTSFKETLIPIAEVLLPAMAAVLRGIAAIVKPIANAFNIGSEELNPSATGTTLTAPGTSQTATAGGTQKVENKVSIAPSDTNITLNLNGAAIGNANARQNYGVGKNVKALGGSVDYSASV